MKYKSVLFIMGVALCFLAFNAGAAGPFAETESISDTINFYPQVPYAKLELTVSGNDFYWRQQFQSGEIASFSSFDGVLPDGEYRYELVASPPYDSEAWAIAEDDRQLMLDLELIERAETYRQFGRFESIEGQLITLENR